jgi:hypothetical protein
VGRVERECERGPPRPTTDQTAFALLSQWGARPGDRVVLVRQVFAKGVVFCHPALSVSPSELLVSSCESDD